MVDPPDINLVSGDFWGRNPHPELAWLRQHDPVYWDARGQVWGITPG
jgi:cytochrome P450 family 142 subfamily A polypeptide 1